MKHNVPERVEKEIAFFARKHGLQQVILFGSRARGNHTARSDVDIAVSGGNFDAFYWDIKENIHSLLSFDVVDLNQSNVSTELKNEISRNGVIIYEKA